MKRLLTVRLSYLYIFGGSALLSGISLFVVHRSFVLVYSHYSSDSTAFFVRFSHWLINHFGRLPLAFLFFTAVFSGIFMLRSQKMADDIKSLLRAAEELAVRGSFGELKIAPVGELGQLAAYLHKINKKEETAAPDLSTPDIALKEETAPGTDLGNEEVLALILRTKVLLHKLEDVEAAGCNPQSTEVPEMEEAKREALGMERFLESLIVRP